MGGGRGGVTKVQRQSIPQFGTGRWVGRKESCRILCDRATLTKSDIDKSDTDIEGY